MFDLEVILSIWTIVPFFVPRHPAKTISGWIEIDFEYKSETYGLKNKVFRQFFCRRNRESEFYIFWLLGRGACANTFHWLHFFIRVIYFTLYFHSAFREPDFEKKFENQYHREFLEKDLWKNLKTKLKGPIYKKS